MVLETLVRAAGGGEARILDFFAIGGECRRLVRIVEGVRGEVRLDVDLAPRFDYGAVRPWLRRDGEALFRVLGGDDGLVVSCDAPLEVHEEHSLRGELAVGAGERARLAVTYMRPQELDEPVPAPPPNELDAQLDETVAWWRDWAACLEVPGDDAAVVRSALTLRALVYEPTGAVLAAPTSSLPESSEGTRAWDYRYSWVRDSTLTARSLAEVGAATEADRFARFVMRTAAGHAEELQVAYGVGGERRIGESQLELSGYHRAG